MGSSSWWTASLGAEARVGWRVWELYPPRWGWVERLTRAGLPQGSVLGVLFCDTAMVTSAVVQPEKMGGFGHRELQVLLFPN